MIPASALTFAIPDGRYTDMRASLSHITKKKWLPESHYHIP